MLTLHLRGGARLDLLTGDTGEVDGGEFVARDRSGKLIARACHLPQEGRSNLAPDSSAARQSSSGLYQRYDTLRRRYLALESEHHQAISEARRVLELRSQARLEGLRLQLMALQEEYVPARIQAVEDTLSKAWVSWFYGPPQPERKDNILALYPGGLGS
jgi:hypothetical protein